MSSFRCHRYVPEWSVAPRSSRRPRPVRHGRPGSRRLPGTESRHCCYEWARAEDRVVGWVSLDRLDDDPGILLAVLASAYVRMFPAGAGLVADVSGLGVSALGRAAPVVASAFRRSPAPFVLMLDDLHDLQSPACHDVLGVVISGVPAGSQLVTASRAEQPHLPRMRASGDALELLAADLALGPGGCRADLLDVPGPAHRGPGRARHRTDRRLAGRPAAGGDDRPRHPPGRLDGLRRRPVRGRLPLPRVAEPAGPDNPALPAPNRGARPAARPALRRAARRCGQPGPVAGPRGVELVPDPARPPAGVVPVPPAVPGVPAQRAAARRARHGHEAAPARRRLVRGERLTGDGAGAPAEHQRAGPLRPAADAAGAADVQRRADVDGQTVAGGARRRRHHATSTADGAGRVDRQSWAAIRSRPNGGPPWRTRRSTTWCRSTGRRRSSPRAPCCEP